MNSVTNPKVVIVGAGFGGLLCARELDGYETRDRRSVNVTLIDRHDYHTFQPLLYQVATSLLKPLDVAYPIRKIFRGSKNVHIRQAMVQSVDFERKVVCSSDGAEHPYDLLVLATGSTTNFFGNEEIERNSFGVKDLPEALQLRNHVLACLERSVEFSDPDERRRLLTFVVCGGGPTGVEFAGALAEFLDLVVPAEYPELKREECQIHLIEGQDRVLGPFHPSLSAYAGRVLEGKGVRLHLGVLVKEASGSRVVTGDGDVIECGTIMWSAGVKPADLGDGCTAEKNKGNRIEVDRWLRLVKHPEVFALGDVACVPDDPRGIPMLAQPAIQQGGYAAARIREIVEGKDPSDATPFEYKDKGTMATVGKNAAVVQLGKLRIRGFVGWVAWMALHIFYLIGFRNRVSVMLSWMGYFFGRDRPNRIMTSPAGDALSASVDEELKP